MFPRMLTMMQQCAAWTLIFMNLKCCLILHVDFAIWNCKFMMMQPQPARWWWCNQVQALRWWSNLNLHMHHHQRAGWADRIINVQIALLWRGHDLFLALSCCQIDRALLCIKRCCDGSRVFSRALSLSNWASILRHRKLFLRVVSYPSRPLTVKLTENC